MTTFMSQPKAHVRKTLLRYTIVTIMATFFIILDIYAVEKIFLISVDNLNIREQPNKTSKVLIQLPVCSPVNILKTNNQTEVIEGKSGKWVYVDTYMINKSNKKDTIKGWVFDYYIGYKNKFSKVTDWKIKNFEYCDGDYCVLVQFDNKGFFTYSYDTTELFADCNECKCLLKSEKQNGKKCFGKGQVFKFNKLIWLKKDGETNKDSKIVYLTTKGDLCAHPSECINGGN